MKNKSLYVAVSFVLLSCSFTFDESQISWMWRDHVQVPIVLISMAIILVGIHIFKSKTNYSS